MKTKINLLLISVIAAFGGMLSSCDDDNGGVAEAVIGSSRSIEFPAQNTAPVMVAIVSDGNWHCDAPEWLTVTPNSGSAGTTDVLISAAENYRDGIDLPRKYTLKFMGETKRSIFEIQIRQAGDKFRDIKPSTIAEADKMEEESAVEFVDLPVMTSTKNGFVGTDGTDLVYVTGEAAKAQPGQLVSMLGTIEKSDVMLTVVQCDKLEGVKEGDVPTVTAVDITKDIDNYKSDKRTYIKVTGLFDGAKLNVEGKTLGVTVEDCNSDIDIKKFNGHFLTLTGVYSGTAAPVLRMIVTEVEDLGANETVFWTEDFEFFDPWVKNYINGDGKSPTDNVGGEYYSGAYNPQSTTVKDSDGSSMWDLLVARGYEMTSTTTAQAKKSVGLCVNYLKMAVTRYTAGLTLPKMPEAGDGVENVHIQFDWTPMTDGGKKVWDHTEIVVVVNNNGEEFQFPVPSVALEDGTSLYQWFNVDITMSGVKINKDSRITIRNVDADYPDCGAGVKKRWFLDNIKVYKPKE